MGDCQGGPRTYGVKKAGKTSEISGRRRESEAQQRWIISHNLSVKFECVGRDGRSPCVMTTIAIKDV